MIMDKELSEKLDHLQKEVEDLLHSYTVEDLPSTDGVEEKHHHQICHGCHHGFDGLKAFGGVIIIADTRLEQDQLGEDLAKGRISWSDYALKSDALIHREHPDDGWYCTRACYEKNSTRHA